MEWKIFESSKYIFILLEKWWNRFIKLWDISNIKRWFTTWINDFCYLPSKYFDISLIGEYYNLTPKEEWIPNSLKIEKKFLKPIIKSPKECKWITIEENEITSKILICNKNKKDLINSEIIKYIQRWEEFWKWHKRPSCKWRKERYILWELSPKYISKSWFNENFNFSYNNLKYPIDKVMYWIDPKEEKNFELWIMLNSSFFSLLVEIFWQKGLWDWLLFLTVETLSKIPIINIDFSYKNFLNYKITKSIFTEIWIDKTKNIRSQTPKPLPDRKELDDIIFDELGLTQEERNEVYRSLAELVKARLDKAKSV